MAIDTMQPRSRRALLTASLARADPVGAADSDAVVVGEHHHSRRTPPATRPCGAPTRATGSAGPGARPLGALEAACGEGSGARSDVLSR
jgi:hypothetical protein